MSSSRSAHEALDLAEVGEVLAADRPQHDRRADQRAERQDRHHARAAAAAERCAPIRTAQKATGDKELQLLQPLGALHRPARG